MHLLFYRLQSHTRVQQLQVIQPAHEHSFKKNYQVTINLSINLLIFTHALEIHISLARYGLLSSNPHSTFSQIFPSGVAAKKKKENIFLQLNHNLKNVNWLPHLRSTHIQLLLF